MRRIFKMSVRPSLVNIFADVDVVDIFENVVDIFEYVVDIFGNPPIYLNMWSIYLKIR